MRTRRRRFARPDILVAVALTVSCRVMSGDQREPRDEGAETSRGGAAPAGGASPAGGSGSRGGENASGEAGIGCIPEGIVVDCTRLPEGLACPQFECAQCRGFLCGLADSGTRDCTCSNGMWQCTPCKCGPSAFCSAPPEILPCPDGAADRNPCVTEGSVCGPVGDEYCACFVHFVDGLIWDCDLAPPDWNL